MILKENQLMAVSDLHKSFYGKAWVLEDECGNKLLKSYDTIVCSIDPDGGFTRLWDGFSATTMKHVNEFNSQFGDGSRGKAWWSSCEVNKTYYQDVNNKCDPEILNLI